MTTPIVRCLRIVEIGAVSGLTNARFSSLSATQLFAENANGQGPSTSRNVVPGNDSGKYLPIQDASLGDLDFASMVNASEKADQAPTGLPGFDLDVDSLLNAEPVIDADVLSPSAILPDDPETVESRT